MSESLFCFILNYSVKQQWLNRIHGGHGLKSEMEPLSLIHEWQAIWSTFTIFIFAEGFRFWSCVGRWDVKEGLGST